jgi:hypothetical protein
MSDRNNVQFNFEAPISYGTPEYPSGTLLNDVIEEAVAVNEAEFEYTADNDDYLDDWDRISNAAEALNRELKYRGFIGRANTRAYVRHGKDGAGIYEDYVTIGGFVPYSEPSKFKETVLLQEEKAQLGLEVHRIARSNFSASNNTEVDSMVVPLSDPFFAIELAEDRLMTTVNSLIHQEPVFRGRGGLSVALYTLTEYLKSSERTKQAPDIGRLATKIASHPACRDNPVLLSELGVLLKHGFEPGGYRLEQKSATTRSCNIEDLENPHVKNMSKGAKVMFSGWLQGAIFLPKPKSVQGLIAPNLVVARAHPSDTSMEAKFTLAPLADNMLLERISD